MSKLGLAISIAAKSFEGKLDKGGRPYILHCLHVMNEVEHYKDDELSIIAVLYDLIEDTEYTLSDLHHYGFSERVKTGIAYLTKPKDIKYIAYIHELKKCSDAVKIKLVDLKHNIDLTRIKIVSINDYNRLQKYLNAYDVLNYD